MLITRQSNQVTYSSPAHTQKKTVKFGDAIFERNNKFEDSVVIPPDTFKEQQKLQAQADPAKKIADFLAASSKSLYDSTGRLIRGKQAIAQALKNVRREYTLRQNEVRNNPSPAAETARDLAGIKLANAQLAADASKASNKTAFTLLSNSLNRLIARGYHHTEQVSPVFIHGLYNRGTYAFNNDLRQKNINYYGTERTLSKDKEFEGLLVSGEDGSAFYKKIKEGLPHLEQAIELADTIPDQQLAKSEYQIAKGEIHHALAHLGASDSKIYYEHSEEARSAFNSALDTLNKVDSSQLTPRHTELIRNLVEVKIPHLDEPGHSQNSLEAFIMQISGVRTFPDSLTKEPIIPEYHFEEPENPTSNASSSAFQASTSEPQSFTTEEASANATKESPLPTVATPKIPRWKKALRSFFATTPSR